ncbi:hypothetical protein AVEN_54062-1 [Araneus ventricosus]|uniref:Uncharacterized protein n=1 Tax=Araneus ventricosus TaxID=182803 RepID=A0A4Y2WDA3_ARAVE|nr:hypothetical protein AVEN_54062-1 [Araneus ventricosus]
MKFKDSRTGVHDEDGQKRKFFACEDLVHRFDPVVRERDDFHLFLRAEDRPGWTALPHQRRASRCQGDLSNTLVAFIEVFTIHSLPKVKHNP